MVDSRHTSACSEPCSRLRTLEAALRPPHCSATLWLLDALLGYPAFSWSPALSHGSSALSSLLGALPPIRRSPCWPGLFVTRPVSATLRTVISCLLGALLGLVGALLVTRRCPVRSSPLAIRTLSDPDHHGHIRRSWLLGGTLLAGMCIWHIPHYFAPSRQLGVIMATGYRPLATGLLRTGRCLSGHSPPSSYWMPPGDLQTRRAPRAELGTEQPGGTEQSLIRQMTSIQEASR